MRGKGVKLKPGHHSSYLLRTNKTSYQIKANATGVAPGKGSDSGSGSDSGLGATVKFEWQYHYPNTMANIDTGVKVKPHARIEIG